MALYRTYKEDGLLWGIWKMEETVDELLSLFPRPDFYQNEMQRFSTESRRKEWLTTRALLFALCGEEKEIDYYPNGKPFLSDRSFYISISHTRGFVAVILHPDVEVGIDIEQQSDRVLKVCSKFVNEDEFAAIIPEKEVQHLLLHWSAKETLFKLMNEQGVDFKAHLHIYPFIPADNGMFVGEELKTGYRKKYNIHYIIHPSFVMTWARGV